MLLDSINGEVTPIKQPGYHVGRSLQIYNSTIKQMNKPKGRE